MWWLDLGRWLSWLCCKSKEESCCSFKSKNLWPNPRDRNKTEKNRSFQVKVKRTVVAEKYAAEIEAMYSGAEAEA